MCTSTGRFQDVFIQDLPCDLTKIIGMQMSTAFRSNSEKAALGHDSVSGQHAPGPNLCQSSPQKSESLLMGAFTVYDCGIRGICSNWNLYHGLR